MDKSVWDTTSAYKTYTQSSVKTPNYWKLKRQGARLPVNPYEAMSIEAHAFNNYGPPDRTSCPLSPNHSLTAGNITCGNGVYGRFEPISQVEGLVQNRLIDKLRNTEIDLGVALGEYRETAQMFSTALTRVRKSIKHLRRGNATMVYRTLVGGKQDRLSDIPRFGSNAYLAYQYGVRPLIKDVQDAAKALQNRYESEPPVIEVRTRKIVPIVSKAEYHEYYYGGQMDAMSLNTISGYYDASAGCRFTVTNPLTRKLDRLGLVNPLAVAWELTTLSFVVDWFLPIGDFLTNIVPPQGVSVVDGWVKVNAWAEVFEQRKSNGYGWPTATGYNWLATPHDYGGKSVMNWKYRKVLSAIPSYTFIVPDISLEKSQIMSGLALLTQAVLGKR